MRTLTRRTAERARARRPFMHADRSEHDLDGGLGVLEAGVAVGAGGEREGACIDGPISHATQT